MESNAPAIRLAGFERPWERKRLGEVSAFLGNNTLSRANLSEADGSALDIHYGDILIKYDSVLHASSAGLPEIVARDSEKLPVKDRLADGDVVFADTAEDMTAGKCCELRGCGDKPIYAGLHTIPVRPSEAFAKGYLGHYLNSSAYHDQLIPLMQGTKVISVSRRNLSDSLLAFPSLPEQEAIGSLLSALDALIEAEGDRLAALRAARESLLSRMFPREGADVPEVRFAGFEGPWGRKRLGEIAQRISISSDNPNLPRVEYEDIASEQGCLNKDLTDLGHTKPGIEFRSGDVLYGKLRPYLHNWLNPSFDGIAVGDFWVLRPENHDGGFVYRLVQTERFDLLANISSGSKMPRADWRLMGNSAFYVPTSLPEQRAIGSFFSRLDALIEARAMRVKTLRRVRSALLARMFC